MHFSNYGDYPTLDGVKKILVIKLRHLGDVLLTTPVFTQLRDQFPHATIDAYVWKEAKDILSDHPGVDHLILQDRSIKQKGKVKSFLHDLSLLKKIRQGNYDLVVQLTEGDRGMYAAWVSGASIRVGVDPGVKWKKKRFTHLVKPSSLPRHTVEKELDALRRLGIFPKEGCKPLTFHVPKRAKESIQALVGEESFVVVHPLARWKYKCLPPKLMAQVIDRIEERVVVTAAASEKGYIDEILTHTKSHPLNLCGKTDLKEFGALMLRAKGVITVDTVALHIASALQVPCVALFGPTSEASWGPWKNPRGCVVAKPLPCRPCRQDGCGGSKMSDCLWTLSPQEVVDALSRVSSEAAPLLVLNSFATKNTE